MKCEKGSRSVEKHKFMRNDGQQNRKFVDVLSLTRKRNKIISIFTLVSALYFRFPKKKMCLHFYLFAYVIFFSRELMAKR